MIDLAERMFDTGSVRLHYVVGPPSGPPLVLLHGGSARWQSTMPLITALRDKWQVYALDLRGHGGSGHVPHRYRLEDYAEDIVLFLQRALTGPAILFGHSLGGQVALVASAQAPDRVKALILGDSPIDRERLRQALARDHERLRLWQTWAGRPANEIELALKELVISGLTSDAPQTLGAIYGEDSPWFREMAVSLHQLDPDQLEAVLEFDDMHAALEPAVLLPRITCPVLIIRGTPELGGALSDAEVDLMRSSLTDVTIASLLTVGHALHTMEPEPVVQAIRSFLTGCQ